MYQFERIKLVIWDLDDTFWKGTISEGSVEIPPKHRELLVQLTDIGIVNSICSKNDFQSTMTYLEENGLAEYFVFPSINWMPKGQRVKKLIEDMQLRPANVLFLDDNPSNLGEVEHFCSGISVFQALAIEVSNNKAVSNMRCTDAAHQHNRNACSYCVCNAFNQSEARAYNGHQGYHIKPGICIFVFFQYFLKAKELYQFFRESQNYECI